MIEGIIYELAQALEPLAFLTRIGAAARAQKVKDGTTEKTLPVARGVLPSPTGENPFIWMQPDSREAGIAYFETLNDTPISSQGSRRVDCAATVRLVVWVNLQRLNPPDTERAALNVLSKIPETLPNSDLAQVIRIEVQGFEPKTPAVFSRYTYDEAELQHLSWPYDFFSIVLSIRYTVVPSSVPDCVDSVELVSAPC